MGCKYATYASGTNAINSTLLQLVSATTIRPRVYEFVLAARNTPTDQAQKWEISRFSAAGVGATTTPSPLDPNDPPSTATAASGMAAEPTYTDALIHVSFNQQATFRWAVPRENAIILPASADNGIGIRSLVVSGGSATNDATFYHEE